MAIPTREALSGFIATDPQLTETSNGGHRFYARVGIEQFQRNEDGSFTQLESEFTNLVMFDKAAERAAEKSRRATTSSPRAEATSRSTRASSASSSSPHASATTTTAPPTPSTGPARSAPARTARRRSARSENETRLLSRSHSASRPSSPRRPPAAALSRQIAQRSPDEPGAAGGPAATRRRHPSRSALWT